MDMDSLVIPIVLLLSGAAIGAVPTYFLERSKQKHALRTRWDAHLLEMSATFADAARNLLHLSERRSRAVDVAEQDRRIDAEHARVRAYSDQLRILGSEDVQRTARLVIHHAYSVRRVGEGKSDRKLEDYGIPARDRLLAALDEFYLAIRHQLGVRDADRVWRFDG